MPVAKLVAIVGELSLLRLYLSITHPQITESHSAHLQFRSLSQFGAGYAALYV